MTSMTRPTRKKKEKEEDDDADKEQSSSSSAAAAAAAAAQGSSDGTTTTTSTSSSIVRIDPPSHILQNGTFVHLPPFTNAERSAFFARSVARYGLVSAAAAAGNGGGGDDGGGGDGGDEEGVAIKDAAAKQGGEGTTKGEEGTKKHKDKKKDDDDTTTPKIHPLALASARLNHVGISEMSKSINLTGLVAGGEYVGLTNIVSSEAERAAAVAVGSDGGVGVGAGATGGSGVQRGDDGDNDDDEEPHEDIATLDATNRSTYTLTHHAHSLRCASHILSRHYNRILLGTTSQSIIDSRLLELRKRWRLVAPEHGTRSGGAVRPNEVIAVDVEVYDRDRVGGGVSSSSHGGATLSGENKRKMGRIAKRVPRYATIEIGDGYGLRGDAEERLAKRRKRTLVEEKKRKEEGGGEKDDDVKMEDVEEQADKKAPDAEVNKIKTEEKDDDDTQSATATATATDEDDDKNNNKEKKPKTIAEPYAVADPTLGKVDLDFDPDQVPLLTLSMSIEKTRTGYVEEVVLSSVSGSSMGSGSSSSSSNATNGGADPQENEQQQQQQAKPADEPVIYALQHSLFCASLFESMRGELASAESGSSPGAWLAGGTDETFLPAPTRMDGAPPAGGGSGGTICVVHCHQGEVKVRLDSEYDLTVKLVEAGTVSSSSSGGADGNKDKDKNKNNYNNAAEEEEMDSGSQSPAYLRALCRALLLHAQSSYHDHRLRMHEKAVAMAAAERAKAASGIPPGLARRKKDAEEERPLILGGVLALGGKMLLERTVRESLRKLSHHIDQRSDITDRLVVDWLTLSMFDSKSYFTASVGPTFTIDVCIDAGGMTVTSFGDEGGEYRSVRYGSAEHFEMYMQFQLMRLARSGNGDSGRRNGGSRQ